MCVRVLIYLKQANKHCVKVQVGAFNKGGLRRSLLLREGGWGQHPEPRGVTPWSRSSLSP